VPGFTRDRQIVLHTDVESAQVLPYLEATGFERAFRIHFATPSLDCKRFIQSGNHLRKSAVPQKSFLVVQTTSGLLDCSLVETSP
jgi:hypothetical protein